MNIADQIRYIKPKLTELISSQEKELERLEDDIRKLANTSSVFENNWVGAWATRSYNYYSGSIFNNSHTIQLSEEEIQDYIETSSGITMQSIKDAISLLLQANKYFRDELITELSIIKGNEYLTSENELFDKIEGQEWGIRSHDYVKMKRPNSIYVQNPAQVFNRGLDIPPHLNIDGEIISYSSMITSIKDFQKNSKRLIRQLEIKFLHADSDELEISIEPDFVYKLIEKFHLVVNQLRNRHAGRDTIQIKDEYDVQDLLYGLLKIHYEDIRPEEHTLSYAGSSTRVDFLLKKERIVIEVKKTRDGLKDKQVGDQLILDTQHYKAHPTTKHIQNVNI